VRVPLLYYFVNQAKSHRQAYAPNPPLRVYAHPSVAANTPIFDQGICVRVWDWSETSQTVAILTRTQGLIRGIAKGAKRERSNFSGGFEVATKGEVGVSIKRGDQLSLLTAWDLRELYPSIRTTSSGFAAGMALLDAAQSSVQPLDPHPGLFDALESALARLSGSREADAAIVTRFLWTALDDTGHKPELTRDVATGLVLEPAATFGFSSRLGGLIANDRSNDAWRVRRETVELLRLLDSPPPSKSSGPTNDAPAIAYERAGKLLALYLREVVGREMPALSAFVEAKE